MKKGSYYIFTLLYVLIGASIFLTPSNIIYAQDDAVEEIFWGDDEEGDLDEEFDFSEDDEEFSDDEEGLEGSTSMMNLVMMILAMMILAMKEVMIFQKTLRKKKRTLVKQHLVWVTR